MKTILKLSIFLFLATLTTSCFINGLNGVTGNRNVIEQTRKINDDYTKIKISNGLDVYITQSNKASITIKADENLLSIIKTEVKNGTLKVYTDKKIGSAKSKKIYITTKSIEAITASSGSDVIIENMLTSPNFEANTSSGANMKLQIKTTTLTSSSSSGSHLNISGSATEYLGSVSSGSSAKAYELESKIVTAKASSGGNIDVFASKSIDARASSGGDIDYKGNPEILNKKTSSGGSISAH